MGMTQYEVFDYCKAHPRVRFTNKQLGEVIGKKTAVSSLTRKLVDSKMLHREDIVVGKQRMATYWWDDK